MIPPSPGQLRYPVRGTEQIRERLPETCGGHGQPADPRPPLEPASPSAVPSRPRRNGGPPAGHQAAPETASRLGNLGVPRPLSWRGHQHPPSPAVPPGPEGTGGTPAGHLAAPWYPGWTGETWAFRTSSGAGPSEPVGTSGGSLKGTANRGKLSVPRLLGSWPLRARGNLRRFLERPGKQGYPDDHRPPPGTGAVLDRSGPSRARHAPGDPMEAP
jgi:hypothetical protein